MDHRRNCVRQPVPRARARGQRRGPVSDDLRARRRLRRPDLDLARPDDRRADGPDAPQAGSRRDGHVADRGDLQVVARRLRRRRRRAGRLDGLPDACFGRSVLRLLPGRPVLGRRRNAGRPGPPVRPHQSRRVPPGVRQAGRPEGLEPLLPGIAQNTSSPRRRNERVARPIMSLSPGQSSRGFSRSPDETIEGIGRALREGRTSCGRS